MADRENELIKSFQNKQLAEEARFQQYISENNKNIELFEEQMTAARQRCDEVITNCNNLAADAQEKYNGLLKPLQQYEKSQQERLYYTIQVPDEYKEDINFLLTTVSQKIQHPDIINKLVWQEYVKPYITETFKRADIREESGIYKITNIDSGKAYIGKSTNIKKRLTDHFKSAIGISGIADQAVHHEIWKTGFWNWTIEPIIYCDKDKLNELEKYYIDFFKTQEFGFNKNVGGGG